MGKKSVVSQAKEAKKLRKSEIVHELNGKTLLGEIICWNARSEESHKHKDVVNALDHAGLDPTIARALLPRFAFTRACKKLEDKAIIDVIKDGEQEIKFQFTRKVLKNEEVKYTKETEIILNKTTGEIKCPNKDLEQSAQRLLDEAMEARTTADITKIVQKLFDEHGELYPIREQGGAYLVLKEHTGFALKIDQFLSALGGKLTRFPVPAGTDYGDRAVSDTVADGIQNLIKQHKDAVANFSIKTRADTIASVTDRINQTRSKLESHAVYIGDQRDKLLNAIEDCDQFLREQIEKINEDKISAPKSSNEIFGIKVTNVLRWMGVNNWDFDDVKKVLNHFGIVVQDTTIRGQMWCGRSGKEKYPVPELKKDQVKQLEALRKG